MMDVWTPSVTSMLRHPQPPLSSMISAYADFYAFRCRLPDDFQPDAFARILREDMAMTTVAALMLCRIAQPWQRGCEFSCAMRVGEFPPRCPWMQLLRNRLCLLLCSRRRSVAASLSHM